MDLGLTQVSVARQLGVDQWSLVNWEKDRTYPTVRSLPAVWNFLGRCLEPDGEGAGDRLRSLRRGLSFSQEAFAAKIGVDPSTVWRWERGRGHCPEPDTLGSLARQG